MQSRFLFFSFILLASIFLAGANSNDILDLSGQWEYILREAPTSIPAEGEIRLPSTLDNEHKSRHNPSSKSSALLRREFTFEGEAIFSRDFEAPQDWKDKVIILTLERTKPALVLIDNETIGYSSYTSSPQKFILPEHIKSGTHKIQIIVNNGDSIPPLIAKTSNAMSDDTQTNWNGILGEISISAKNPFHISGVTSATSVSDRTVTLKINFSKPSTSPSFLFCDLDGDINKTVKVNSGSKSAEISFPLDSIKLWSHRHPNLYDLKLALLSEKGDTTDIYQLKTGFRDFSTSGKNFIINGSPVFLHGTVNDAVFPIYVHTPTDLNSWLNYFTALKEFGLNHVRFKTWTPPEAAFQAADSLGFYLMTELPIWGELDRDLTHQNQFLKKELEGIMNAYSHHPSFVMFSPGNELFGDLSLMKEYMLEAKKLNPEILTTYGSNVYLGMFGEIGGEDFILSSKTSDLPSSSIRASFPFSEQKTGGLFNSEYPSNDWDYSAALSNITVPVISHEVGQYQSYPVYSQIDKFTGNLKPDNLILYQQQASEAGFDNKLQDFTEASGHLAQNLYLAEIEAALRSPGIAGYQLLGIQDYPAQGFASIGMTDAFMDKKPFVSIKDWKDNLSDISIIARFPKITFVADENVNIPVSIVNFSDKKDNISTLEWHTDFAQGNLDVTSDFGRNNIGEISFRIPKTDTPQKKELVLVNPENKIKKTYDFYIFPSHTPAYGKITVTDNLDYAIQLLEKGEKVLLCPDTTITKATTINPLFTTDFYNYSLHKDLSKEMNMPVSPGTLGLMINNKHEALKKFPSETYTDWVWWPIVMNSKPLIIDRLPNTTPAVIEVIDNPQRHLKLGLLLEFNVGKGKLMILNADKDKLADYTEGQWLIKSITDYMAGKSFKPKISITPDQLVNLLTKPSDARKLKELLEK